MQVACQPLPLLINTARGLHRGHAGLGADCGPKLPLCRNLNRPAFTNRHPATPAAGAGREEGSNARGSALPGSAPVPGSPQQRRHCDRESPNHRRAAPGPALPGTGGAPNSPRSHGNPCVRGSPPSPLPPPHHPPQGLGGDLGVGGLGRSAGPARQQRYSSPASVLHPDAFFF